MMVENGGKEPIFNVDKITAFEVISYSAIKHTDLQNNTESLTKSFPKLFPMLFPKLIPAFFQENDAKDIELLLKSLIEPKSTKELASVMSCSTRTVRDKYLDKMLQAGVVAMTIPDKPKSSKQQYKIAFPINNNQEQQEK